MQQIRFAIQDRDKERQKHQDLYWLTLPQGLHPVSLLTSKEIHSKITNINQIQDNYTFTK